MVHTSEHLKEKVIRQALFEAFAFKFETTEKYYKPLSRIKNYSLLAEVIKEIGREKAINTDLVISTELISSRFWSRYKEEKYKSNASSKCCFCLNTGTITSFVDEYGHQIEWKNGPVAEKVTESMIVCECGKGDNIISHPAKNKDNTPDVRRKLKIKYGMTAEDIMQTEIRKGIALGYQKMWGRNADNALSEEDYLCWFKKWYIDQCWKEYRKQIITEVNNDQSYSCAS